MTGEKITDNKYYPDFIELSKAGTKIRIAFNIDNPEEAVDRIDEGLGIRSYAVNAFMAKIEKLTKEEKR